MKNNINVDIRVPSHTRYLRMIGRIGEEVARETDCPPGIRETLPSLLAIVLTEGVVNAIKHAHSADPEGGLHVRINVSKKDLVVRIYDNGIGFDLNAVPNPSLASNGLEEKGRGIFIIRSLMDTVKYIRSDEANVLEMRKSLI
jgi:serine/threonine-protein kinase RsbW